jgi:hypothetical protein
MRQTCLQRVLLQSRFEYSRENKCEHLFFRIQEIRFYVVWHTLCDIVRKMLKAKDISVLAYCVTSLGTRFRQIANISDPIGRFFEI